MPIPSRFLGKIPSYEAANRIQNEVLRSILENRNRPGELLLFEIDRPTITIGRREHYAVISPEKQTEYNKLRCNIRNAGAEFIEVDVSAHFLSHEDV